MSQRRLLIAIFSTLLGGIPPAAPQDTLIDSEIDSVITESRWQLGPLRLNPSLAANIGYDSNPLSLPEDPIEDVLASVGSGLVAAVPFGRRGVFELREGLSFVYYRRLENLRDINNFTSFAGAFGGKSVLVRLRNVYRNGRTRPSSEFDVPVRQITNDFSAATDVELGWRHKLTFGFDNTIVRIRDTGPDIDEETVQDRLNRTETRYSLALFREMTEKTTTLIRGFYRILDFQDDSRDGWAYGLEGGFRFAPQENVNGRILLGYQRVDPTVPSQPSSKGLIADVNVSFRFDERYGLGAIYSRGVSPSVLENNWFFIQNRYGATFTVSLTELLSVGAGATFGRNTYPRPVTLVNDQGEEVEEIVTERFDDYSLVFTYRVAANLGLSLSGHYNGRESPIRVFAKDRLLVILGISVGI